MWLRWRSSSQFNMAGLEVLWRYDGSTGERLVVGGRGCRTLISILEELRVHDAYDADEQWIRIKLSLLDTCIFSPHHICPLSMGDVPLHGDIREEPHIYAFDSSEILMVMHQA